MAITVESVKQIYGECGAQEIYQEVKSKNDFVGFAHSFIFCQDYVVARNALWVLTKASVKELSALQVMLNEIIDLAMTTENSSVRRLSLSIIERLEITEDNLRADFLDFCLERMMCLDEFPGVQTNSMKLAFRMCKFYPELMDELMVTIKTMHVEFYKPAVKCVRNRILNGKLK